MFSLMPWRKERRADDLAAHGHTPLDVLRREFAPLFDRLFGDWPMFFEAPLTLPGHWGIEMEDTGQDVVVRVEAPGYEAKDLKVELAGNLLTITAEPRELPEEGRVGRDAVAQRLERPLGTMHRVVTLPTGLDLEKLEARYRNGILEVRVPRLPEARARSIEVKT